MTLSLTVLEPALAVVRLPAGEGLPWWAGSSAFLSLTRTADETSVVCEESRVPEGVRVERGLRGLRVDGTLSLQATGILAGLAEALAVASVPIFVISTYDTDYILVPAAHLTRATEALRKAGHSVTE